MLENGKDRVWKKPTTTTLPIAPLPRTAHEFGYNQKSKQSTVAKNSGNRMWAKTEVCAIASPHA